MPVPRIALFASLALAIAGPDPTGAVAPARDGDRGTTVEAAAQPAPSWPADALLVAAANKALIEYARLNPAGQRRLAHAAYRIAEIRRSALARLIRADPRTALRLSLSPGQRQGLPKFVLDLLEARVHAVGDLTQAVTEIPPVEPDPNAPGAPPHVISWSAEIGQRSLQAFVYGLRLRHQTEFETPIHGIAVDDVLAVDESPLYRYDPFETLQLGFQPGQIVATAGGQPIPLPDLEAFNSLKQQLIDQLLRFGPRGQLVDLYAWTTGPKRVLVIKADFGDRTGAIYSDAEIAAVMEETNAFFEENSQGRTSLAATIIPTTLRLPSTATGYAASGEALGHQRIRDDALAAARAYDMEMGTAGAYDPDGYDRALVLTPQVFSRPIARGDLGGRSVVVSGARARLSALAHEFGHTYGFIHSAFWVVPFGADPLGPGFSDEYGDAWDMMGAPTLDRTDEDPRRRHVNAFFKTLAGWLPPAAIADGTRGGLFRLRRHDAADAAGLRAIRIVADGEKTYWLDMRRQFPWNPSMSMGFEVRRVLNDPGFVYGPVQLLDMDSVTPGVAGVTVFHSLVRFLTFTDASSGVSIRVANVFADEEGDYADIVITR